MPPRLSHPHPRLLLHLLRRASPHHPRHTSTIPRAPPAPPRLAPAEQAEFERLQRLSGGNAFTTSQHHNPEPAGALEHPDVRRGAPPEFEGDVNPRTGEVGGPKNDPLRHGDYSFNGRVTDF